MACGLSGFLRLAAPLGGAALRAALVASGGSVRTRAVVSAAVARSDADGCPEPLPPHAVRPGRRCAPRGAPDCRWLRCHCFHCLRCCGVATVRCGRFPFSAPPRCALRRSQPSDGPPRPSLRPVARRLRCRSRGAAVLTVAAVFPARFAAVAVAAAAAFGVVEARDAVLLRAIGRFFGFSLWSLSSYS